MTALEPEEELKSIEDDKGHLYTRLLQFADTYLDDGKWHKRTTGEVWVRMIKGERAVFNVLRDSLMLGNKRWRPSAAAYLYDLKKHGELDSEMIDATDAMTQYEKSLRDGSATLLVMPHKPTMPLTPREEEIMQRVPPSQDVLCTVFGGYDADNKRLFRVNSYGALEYVQPDLFVTVLGVRYAYWRVVSMMLFGNPLGIADPEKHRDVLASAPNVITPQIVVDRKHLEFRYRQKPEPKTKVATPKEAAARGGRKRPYPEYSTTAEILSRRALWERNERSIEADRIRVAEIKAEITERKRIMQERKDDAVLPKRLEARRKKYLKARDQLREELAKIGEQVAADKRRTD